MDFREMPVLMKEQKENGKKDQYIEITKVLTEATDRVQARKEKLELLEALIGTLENMDFQIYELYRALADCFKKVLKELLTGYSSLEAAEKQTVSEAVKRACAIRILLEEKYEAYIL